jgi:ligand-binding SRPBCC domain-containing protein
MASFQAEQWVPYPIEQVFAFFSDPANLPRILPPGQRARIDQVRLVAPQDGLGTDGLGGAGVGTEIEISLCPVPFLPVRAKWVARITGFARNQFFVDEQIRGPFQSWKHRHEFESRVRAGQAGTVLRDIVEFEAGFGPFGKMGEALFIQRQLRGTFTHRQQALEPLLRRNAER